MNVNHKAAGENLLRIMEDKLNAFQESKSVKELFENVCQGIENNLDFESKVEDGKIVYFKTFEMKGLSSIKSIQGMCIELTLKYGPYIKTAKATGMRSVKIELFGESFI